MHRRTAFYALVSTFALAACAHAPATAPASTATTAASAAARPAPPSATAPTAADPAIATAAPPASDADGAAAPRAKNIAPNLFMAELVEHPYPHLPDAVKIAHVNQQLVFMAKICADGGDGHVTRVSVLQSIPDADEAIVAQLQRWRVRPQPGAIGLCTLTRFVFDIHGRFR